jgi:hypothetical protein
MNRDRVVLAVFAVLLPSQSLDAERPCNLSKVFQEFVVRHTTSRQPDDKLAGARFIHASKLAKRGRAHPLKISLLGLRVKL